MSPSSSQRDASNQINSRRLGIKSAIAGTLDEVVGPLQHFATRERERGEAGPPLTCHEPIVQPRPIEASRTQVFFRKLFGTKTQREKRERLIRA